MPNHVNNIVTFTGPSRDIKALIELVAGVDQPFSFDKIIPMPKILRETHSGNTTINGQEVRVWREKEVDGGIVKEAISEKERQQMIKKYGADGWYEWSCKHWGTKWDCYDAEITFQDAEEVIYIFNSAWSSPEPVMLELSRRFPTLTINVECDGEIDEPYSYSFDGKKKVVTTNVHR